MKRLIPAFIIICCMLSPIFAQQEEATTATADTTITDTAADTTITDTATDTAADTAITDITTDTTTDITTDTTTDTTTTDTTVDTNATTTIIPLEEQIFLIRGYLIDNMCANSHKDDLANFVKTHPKECAIAPGCMESGYSLFTEFEGGKLFKFDKESSDKIAEYLKKEDSSLAVILKVILRPGDELSLVSVEGNWK